MWTKIRTYALFLVLGTKYVCMISKKQGNIQATQAIDAKL